MKPARGAKDIIMLSDLYEVSHALLLEHGITTYTELFALIDDSSKPSQLRCDLLWTITQLSDQVDRRRVVWVVHRALRSSDHDIRMAALHMSGMIHLKGAIPMMMSLIHDDRESNKLRNAAVRALDSFRSSRYKYMEWVEKTVCNLIFYEPEAIELRAQILECFHDAVIKYYGLAALTGLLSHPSADLRFWAAFGFPLMSGCKDDDCRHDITAAIPALDRLVAFDRTVPDYWGGWHVGREGLEALENFYAHQHSLSGRAMLLISPAKEYMTFSKEMRIYINGGSPFGLKDGHDVRPTLNVDPAWLADHLRAAFPGVNFEARPGSQAYLLSWLVETEGETILGGLHRDGYALVLTGEFMAIMRVARWYRSIISSETPLYLYEWAGPAELLEGL